MSYTHGKISWEAHDPQNTFGDMEYVTPRAIRARKQPHQEIVKTGEGKELMSKSIFYVEPSESNVTDISEMDKLDGELVISRYVMMSLFNKPKMYRFITV